MLCFTVKTPFNLGFLRTDGGAGSRVVKSLGCGAYGPGFKSRCHQKCWAVMELFVYTYLYEFILCLVYVRIRCFTLC